MKCAEKRMNVIKNDSIVNKIIMEFNDAIKSGRFVSGQKIPSEFELMEELGVSRNSLREAMKVLSTMGVVDIKRGDGTYICTELKTSILDSFAYAMMLEHSTNEEIVELRQTLDEDVLDLAIDKFNSENIECLKAYVQEMKNYFKMGDIEKASRADFAFHIYMAENIQNRFLFRIVKSVYSVFENSIGNNIRTNDLFADSIKHHEEIIACLENRDKKAVKEVVSHSLSSWKNNIKQKIK